MCPVQSVGVRVNTEASISGDLDAGTLQKELYVSGEYDSLATLGSVGKI